MIHPEKTANQKENGKNTDSDDAYHQEIKE